MYDATPLGERIKQAIEACPYSAREVAEEIGITPQAISKALRSNKMGKDNLRKMADFVGVDRDWLINGKSVSPASFDADGITECVMVFKKVIKEVGMTNIDETEITRLALKLYQANL